MMTEIKVGALVRVTASKNQLEGGTQSDQIKTGGVYLVSKIDTVVCQGHRQLCVCLDGSLEGWVPISWVTRTYDVSTSKDYWYKGVHKNIQVLQNLERCLLEVGCNPDLIIKPDMTLQELVEDVMAPNQIRFNVIEETEQEKDCV